MPNIHEHLLWDQYFFGYSYGQFRYIHYLIDHGAVGYVATFSKGHRKFMHDSRAVKFILDHYGFQVAEVARSHIVLDKVWSSAKRSAKL